MVRVNNTPILICTPAQVLMLFGLSSGILVTFATHGSLLTFVEYVPYMALVDHTPTSVCTPAQAVLLFKLSGMLGMYIPR